MALDDPNGLSPAGTLVACPSHLSPYEGAPQPGERAYSGTVRWPLITLEPALHHWLGLQEHPTPVALVGCQNHAGPWLRVSRLAG